MASSSLSKTTMASASPVVAKRCPNLALYNSPSRFSVSYPLSSQHKLPLFIITQGLRPDRNYPTSLKAQVNEDAKDPKPSNEPWPSSFATEESISQFISQVSSLVKLVDSRDIVELQLKQFDCELIIRKKEALPQPPSPALAVMMSSPPPQHAISPPPPAASAAASSSAPAVPLPTSSPPPAKSAKSSLPALKCPMAGTFYRSPAPGEPPFVKVGEKVQKGQVLCIIEAMKLMNEIEADQSGTLVEILVEDGKPVSVDMPLFVIEP
uniref:Biotin carboxyl carrier protein of acetyl-CoA carboxylase n=1 Tax=Rhizophora mucronata TaxID=61149 RepID=A0A2P2J945_RHIMU